MRKLFERGFHIYSTTVGKGELLFQPCGSFLMMAGTDPQAPCAGAYMRFVDGSKATASNLSTLLKYADGGLSDSIKTMVKAG